jgi:hypothetical protein
MMSSLKPSEPHDDRLDNEASDALFDGYEPIQEIVCQRDPSWWVVEPGPAEPAGFDIHDEPTHPVDASEPWRGDQAPSVRVRAA